MSPPAGAAARVFSIPELLEMILLEVPDALQLFLLRSTNSTFKDTIAIVKSLRKRIFLEHSPDRTYEDINDFLEQVQVKSAAAPFSFLAIDTAFSCSLDDTIKPESRRSPRQQLFPGRRLKSSWRGILVGLSERAVRVELNWQGRETPWRSMVRSATTLGEVVEVAETMVVGSWMERERGEKRESREGKRGRRW